MKERESERVQTKARPPPVFSSLPWGGRTSDLQPPNKMLPSLADSLIRSPIIGGILWVKGCCLFEYHFYRVAVYRGTEESTHLANVYGGLNTC